MKQIIKSQKGETLIETLVAMLTIVLSVALLCTCVMTAANINKDTREADKVYREELLAAEGRTGTARAGQVKITSSSGNIGLELRSVTIYGDDTDDFISYDYEVSP